MLSQARAASTGQRLPRLGRVATAGPAASEEPFAGVSVVIRDGRHQEGRAALDKGIEDVLMRRTPLSPSDRGVRHRPRSREQQCLGEHLLSVAVNRRGSRGELDGNIDDHVLLTADHLPSAELQEDISHINPESVRCAFRMQQEGTVHTGVTEC